MIGATNLDASEGMYWNIGRIANTGHADSLSLIREILRASASIPGVFPPVYIKAQTPDGETYDEMHVDGGTSSQLFLYPSQTRWSEMTDRLNVQGTPNAYLIRNSRVRPRYKPVDPKLIPIAGRTIDSLIRTQGVGDIYRVYSAAERDGVDVFVTWIPEEAGEDTSEQTFDPKYMSQLFDFGYRQAIEGNAWQDMEAMLKGQE